MEEISTVEMLNTNNNWHRRISLINFKDESVTDIYRLTLILKYRQTEVSNTRIGK